ncbi:MAG: hypothetical protein LBM98_00445 [Oscillospiraceae bacterium]|nr:hypothetical protein [Oscillospiraceae bacterium]
MPCLGLRNPRPNLATAKRTRALSLRSTGTFAIRRVLQVRSNPVPGGYDN